MMTTVLQLQYQRSLPTFVDDLHRAVDGDRALRCTSRSPVVASRRA
jgi:hypothetical protein